MRVYMILLICFTTIFYIGTRLPIFYEANRDLVTSAALVATLHEFSSKTLVPARSCGNLLTNSNRRLILN